MRKVIVVFSNKDPVLRGGSWGHEMGDCRVSLRGRVLSALRLRLCGIRLCFYLDHEKEELCAK